jgi:hypothetical protein
VSFTRKVDWALLRNQKAELLSVIEEAQDDNDNRRSSLLQGIAHLLDNMQDYAVDKEGEDATLVFGTLKVDSSDV